MAVLSGPTRIKYRAQRFVRSLNVLCDREKHPLSVSSGTFRQKACGVEQNSAVGKFDQLSPFDTPFVIYVVALVVVWQSTVVENLSETLPWTKP